MTPDVRESGRQVDHEPLVNIGDFRRQPIRGIVAKGL
jgi:hypothetical protein